MKHLVGKTVYLWPTGNNVSRSRGAKIADQIKTAEVVKVARVNLTIKINGRDWSYRYSAERMTISGDCNSGYMVYESMQDLNDYQEVCRLSDIISRKIRYSSDLIKLGLKKVRDIADLIDVV